MFCRVTEVGDERDLLLFTVLSDDYQDDGDDVIVTVIVASSCLSEVL